MLRQQFSDAKNKLNSPQPTENVGFVTQIPRYGSLAKTTDVSAQLFGN
jgi:hypothetical protein